MGSYVVTNKPKPGKKRTYTVTDKALAQRRTNVAPREITTPEGYDRNRRKIDHIMKVNEIATHADRNDLVSMRSCFLAYLKLCQENGMHVSNMGAYAALGMNAIGFAAYAQRKDPAIREFCQFVKNTCSMYRETMIADGELNPVIGIFWQRNFDGLRNDTEQVQALAESQEEDTSTAYKEKYRRLIGE